MCLPQSDKTSGNIMKKISNFISKIFILNFNKQKIIYNNKQSIHLENFSNIPEKWLNNDLGNKWNQLKLVRQVCNVAIEEKRTNKELGSSLEADLEIYLEKKYYNLVKDVDLSEFCITSKAKAIILNGSAKSKLFKLDDIHGIEVLVKKATGVKCSLCWKIKEKKCNRKTCAI